MLYNGLRHAANFMLMLQFQSVTVRRHKRGRMISKFKDFKIKQSFLGRIPVLESLFTSTRRNKLTGGHESLLTYYINVSVVLSNDRLGIFIAEHQNA